MLINITGIDGCGKSTQVSILAKKLRKKNSKIFTSKAFGSREKAIYSSEISKLNQKAIMFLFQALHVQQHKNVVNHEEKGYIVISDRWDDSFIVYHRKFGVLSENKDLREALNDLAFEGKKADLTFLLDIDPEISMQRLVTRGKSFLDEKPFVFF